MKILTSSGILQYIMKAQIHPTYYSDAQVFCACGKIYTIGSTQPKIHVELCSNCHPFYTGEQKFVDSASRIQKFQDKQKKATEFKITVTKKKEEQIARQNAPKTLAEMLAGLK